MKIDVKNCIIYTFEDKSDLSQAVLKLGEKGYFSDDKDFSNYATGTLTRVLCWNDTNEFPFVYSTEKTTDSARYFIPEDQAVFKEEKRKTLRPFKSLEEFFNVTGFKVGDIVQIKRFGNLNYEETAILTSIKLYLDGEYRRVEICFGSTARSLSDLFKCCKYFKNGEWLPFGVEE